MCEVSALEEIEQIEMEAPHVVLLGAGASRAAFPIGDAHGKKLPLMADFVDIVPVGDILLRAGINCAGLNFEELYAELCKKTEFASVRAELERVVCDYFTSLCLPPEPTLYDHLILSLRKKDVIATFNWDPFLIQAVRRNSLVHDRVPSICFLHGNVAAGYCRRDNVHGVWGARCSQCGDAFEGSPLLYPVSGKSYDQDPAIVDAWQKAKAALKSAFMVTIFGYGAPQSDGSAIALLLDAWGGASVSPMKQFEVIDVRAEDELVLTWGNFIHSHHYEVHSDAYDSWLFNHPRRSGEAYLNQYFNALFVDTNPIPRNVPFSDLNAWLTPLIERERRVQ